MKTAHLKNSRTPHEIPRYSTIPIQRFLWSALAIILCLIPSTAAPLTSSVSVEPVHSRTRYPAGNSYPISFRVHIRDSLYIHGPEKGPEGMVPATLAFSQAPGVSVKQITFPPPQQIEFDYLEDKAGIYSGEFLVQATLQIGKEAEPGEAMLEGEFSFQACSGTACLPPEDIPVSLRLEIAPEGAPSRARNQEIFSGLDTEEAEPWNRDTGFWLTLLSLFAGGLALNLTPCIYPLIPITVSYFGGRSGRIKGAILLHGLFFIGGLSITNSLLGVTASLSGGMLGAVLQEPAVLGAVALVLLLLGLSFFGLWEFRLPSPLVRISSKSFGGYFGTLFMGLTLGIVAAPCLGPFILGLLTYVGRSGDPFLGFAYFFVLSLGLGLPLSILAVFSGTLEKLPASGEWMVWIRRIFGWVLVGMAVYIVDPLIDPFTESSILYAVLFLSAGIHLGWLDRTRSSWRGFQYIKRATGIGLIASAAFIFPWSPEKSEGINWVSYHEGILEEAAQRDRPVILDFYADWCIPCRRMDQEVFSGPEVKELSMRFLTVRVDLTDRNAAKERLRKEYNVKGIPTVIFLQRNGKEKRSLRIESHVSKKEFISRTKRLLGKPSRRPEGILSGQEEGANGSLPVTDKKRPSFP